MPVVSEIEYEVYRELPHSVPGIIGRQDSGLMWGHRNSTIRRKARNAPEKASDVCHGRVGRAAFLLLRGTADTAVAHRFQFSVGSLQKLGAED